MNCLIKPASSQRIGLCAIFLLSALCPSSTKAENPVLWPNRGPYRYVGRGNDVKMPIAVAQDTRNLLGTPPSEWFTDFVANYEHQHVAVVSVGTRQNSVSYVVASRFWRKLTPEDLPGINLAIRHLLKGCDLENESKLREYLFGVEYLLYGGAQVMDRAFFSSLHSFDLPKEHPKEFDTLRQLCHRPTLVIQGNEAAITYNLFLYANQGVLRRTIHVKMGKWVELTRIESVEVYPTGSFPNAAILFL